MLTAKQFAKRAKVSYPTVIAWLSADLIPGADKQETPLGTFWQIPASSVDKVSKRKPGPTPKKVVEAGGAAATGDVVPLKTMGTRGTRTATSTNKARTGTGQQASKKSRG